MAIKLSYIYCSLLIFLAPQARIYGQGLAGKEPNQNKEIVGEKKHFISINPIKPFIGLPNLHYEFQLRKNIGLTAFSEVLAYVVISNFNHPDAVNTIGCSFYPFIGNQAINQGAFVNINSSYVSYFRESSDSNSFANGIQIGYKWLLSKRIFIEPKLVSNYVYVNKSMFPGFEILMGINL